MKSWKQTIPLNAFFKNKSSTNQYVEVEILRAKNIPEDLKEFSDILNTIFKEFKNVSHNNRQFSKNPNLERANLGIGSLKCFSNKDFEYRLTPDNTSFYMIKKNKNYDSFFKHIKQEILNANHLMYFPMDKVVSTLIEYQVHFQRQVLDHKHHEVFKNFLQSNRNELNQFLDPSMKNTFIKIQDEQKLLESIERQNTQIRDHFSTHSKINELVSDIIRVNNQSLRPKM